MSEEIGTIADVIWHALRLWRNDAAQAYERIKSRVSAV
jgi:hypothetical protein